LNTRLFDPFQPADSGCRVGTQQDEIELASIPAAAKAAVEKQAAAAKTMTLEKLTKAAGQLCRCHEGRRQGTRSLRVAADDPQIKNQNDSGNFSPPLPACHTPKASNSVGLSPTACPGLPLNGT
jgi:hypothetical protein